MTHRDLYAKMNEAIVAGDREAAAALAAEAVAAGLDPAEVVERGYVPGIQKVGELWEQGEYFLPELISSAEAMKAAMAVLEPEFERRHIGARMGGKVVIGGDGDAGEQGNGQRAGKRATRRQRRRLGDTGHGGSKAQAAGLRPARKRIGLVVQSRIGGP